jgi:hypothetical protein
MDLIKKADEIVNGRNDIYPPISNRPLSYILSGIEIKLERTKDVINKIRNVNTTAYVTKGDIDTLVDLLGYTIDLGNRINENIVQNADTNLKEIKDNKDNDCPF